MLTEKLTMLTETVYSEDRQHRYLLRKEWDETKPNAMIIMTNASTADLLTMDYTTLYILNNVAKLDFGSIDIVNLQSRSMTKLSTKEDIHLNADNVEQILKSAEKADKVIIAWGKLGENNKKIRLIQLKLLEKLKPFEKKLYHIANENGESGFHPLAPQIRFTWILERYVLPEFLQDKENPKEKKTTRDRQIKKA